MTDIQLRMNRWQARAVLRACQRRHTDLLKKSLRKPFVPPDGKIDVTKAVMGSLDGPIKDLEDALNTKV